ncbi:MAG TPA: hypothetical protein VFF30_19895 [Nitrososphaerales archaeon]|nr:hypothetical protein [Nitrososphaerales archaeon]
MLPLLAISLDTISSDAAFLSSIAIILGAIFVVFQMRDDKRLIESSIKQANASSEQAKLTTEQLKQNYDLATVDLITRIYDFANGLEFQNSWLTVLKTKISSFEEYEQLPEQKQLALHQVASLFESIGLLVERGFVKVDLVNDMFATQLAWNSLEPYVTGLRNKYPGEDYYFFFERLHNRLSSTD